MPSYPCPNCGKPLIFAVAHVELTDLQAMATCPGCAKSVRVYVQSIKPDPLFDPPKEPIPVREEPKDAILVCPRCGIDLFVNSAKRDGDLLRTHRFCPQCDYEVTNTTQFLVRMRRT